MKKDSLKKMMQDNNAGGIDALIQSTAPTVEEVETEKKKIKTLTIPEELHSKIRKAAALNEMKISEVVTEAFAMYFSRLKM